MEQRVCVRCGKGLPSMSKMTEEKVPAPETEKFGWAGRVTGPEEMTVAMCLQCQIVRSEDRKRPPV